MTSFHARVLESNDAHVRVTIFAGPDPEHRAFCGELVFNVEEFHIFAILWDTHFESERSPHGLASSTNYGGEPPGASS